MRKLISLLLIFIFTGIVQAQPPKREMRAGWLATVYRIDWPTTAMTSVTSANISAQKAEFTAILDSVKAANMNAVFFQVRPESDAFYNSAYEPWSAHLGGSRGTYPGYDPLAFAIEESHKRGIELHAWLNPYRFETSAGKYAGQTCDYKTLHPEWILDYAVYTGATKTTDGITILDPGNPAVRKLIKNVVGDILSKYDIDGIIFDDYFYAYAGTSTTLDSYAQNLYKPTTKTLSDWRRENVNKMIADVYDTIQAVKPQVIFGVSPFGIWTTSSAVATARGLTLPSGITGSNMYEQIYCDPVAWLEQGKVDYISPQLYWTTTSTGQDYDKLCPWWSDVAKKYNKYFYSSMSLSSLTSTYAAPKASTVAIPWIDLPENLHEMKQYTRNGGVLTGLTRTEQKITAATEFADAEVGLEIDQNRASTKNAAPGAVFYSIKHLRTNGKFAKYLREQKFTKPALTPAVSWKTHAQLSSPTNVNISRYVLSWNFGASIAKFAIYAIPNALKNDATVFNSSTYLLGVSYTNSFNISAYTGLLNTHQFAVTAIDRYGNEYSPSFIVTENAEIPNNISFTKTAEGIVVHALENTEISLYTISGQLILHRFSSSDEQIQLPKGISILKLNDKSYKLIQ